jgi:hypothetical protein
MVAVRKVTVFGPDRGEHTTQLVQGFIQLEEGQFHVLRDAARDSAPVRSALDQLLSTLMAGGIIYGAPADRAETKAEKTTRSAVNGRLRSHWSEFLKQAMTELLVYGLSLTVTTSSCEPRVVPLRECKIYYRRDPDTQKVEYVVFVDGPKVPSKTHGPSSSSSAPATAILSGGGMLAGDRVVHRTDETDATYLLWERDPPDGDKLTSSLLGIVEAQELLDSMMSSMVVAAEHNSLPTVVASVEVPAADEAAARRADELAVEDSKLAHYEARSVEQRFATGQVHGAASGAESMMQSRAAELEQFQRDYLNSRKMVGSGIKTVPGGLIGLRRQFPMLPMPPGFKVANNAAMRPEIPAPAFESAYILLLSRVAQGLGVPLPLLVAASHQVHESATEAMMFVFYTKLQSLREEALTIARSTFVLCYGRRGEGLIAEERMIAKLTKGTVLSKAFLTRDGANAEVERAQAEERADLAKQREIEEEQRKAREERSAEAPADETPDEALARKEREARLQEKADKKIVDTNAVIVSDEEYAEIDVDMLMLPASIDPVSARTLRDQDGCMPFETFVSLVPVQLYGIPRSMLAKERLDPQTDRPLRELAEEAKESEDREFKLREKAAEAKAANQGGGDGGKKPPFGGAQKRAPSGDAEGASGAKKAKKANPMIESKNARNNSMRSKPPSIGIA